VAGCPPNQGTGTEYRYLRIRGSFDRDEGTDQDFGPAHCISVLMHVVLRHRPIRTEVVSPFAQTNAGERAIQ
jgi:hypothetical protein